MSSWSIGRHGGRGTWSFRAILLKRMIDRRFNETDLRAMLESAHGYHEDIESGRWVIETRYDSLDLEVIVAPSVEEQILIVITAYPITRGGK